MNTRPTIEEELPNFKPKLYGIILLVSIIAFCGITLVSYIARMDSTRDWRQWQDKLNLIVESRRSEVSSWVERNFSELRSMADNPSLQIYLTELQMSKDAPAAGSEDAPAEAGAESTDEISNASEEEPAQKTYIRNMLGFVADRMGFSPSNKSSLTQAVPASIAPTNHSGIALIDNKGDIIVATAMLSPLHGVLGEALKKVESGEQRLLDITRAPDGSLLVGFVVPVYSIQGEQKPENQIARIVAISKVSDSLYNLLRHPGVTEETLEVGLLRKEGDQVVYLSPLMDGSKPLEKRITNEPDSWAEAYAVKNAGGFESRLDYRAVPVFITARAVHNTPWFVIAKIDKSEALADSQTRRNGMVVMLLLALAIVVAVIIAVWRHASLRRSRVFSRRFKMMADRATAKEQLLRLVTDNQSEAVYIIDEEQRYQFANKKAAENVGMYQAAVIGKPVVDVVGAARAAPLLATCDEALARHESTFAVRHLNENGAEHIIRAEHIPLLHIPEPNLPEGTPGVLVVEQDVTELVQERERRLKDHKQLLDTLIMLVDKRDPNAAHHSALVSFVAERIAEQLQLDRLMRDTTQLAGSLMNIGKIVIPEQVLTKPERLNEEERRSIRESIYASADVLSGIPFEGPVVDTLRQSQEHFDGTGPKGTKGEDILITARIIAVANSFVGMISKRAYRAASTIDEAVKMLLEQVDKQYDRRVVVALADYVENKNGEAEINNRMKSAARKSA